MTKHRPSDANHHHSHRPVTDRVRRTPLPLLIAGALTGTVLALTLAGSQDNPSRHGKAVQDRLAQAVQDLGAPLAREETAGSEAEETAEAAPPAAARYPHDLEAMLAQPSLLPEDTAQAEAETMALGLSLDGDGTAEDEAGNGATVSKTLSVGKGDTLIKLMTSAGADRSESHEAVSALRTLFDPKRLQLGQEITLTFSRDEDDALRLVGLNMAASVERTVAVQRQEDGGFAANETLVPLASEMVRAGGIIDDSLFMSAQRAGIPPAIMLEMVRLFSYDVDFQREVQPGDSFEIYFERFHDEQGRPVKEGAITFAEMRLSGQPLRYWRYAPDGDEDQADYFNEDGQSVRKALLRTPIDGARLTSGFGVRRHPILGYSLMHKGVDFGAPTGTPIMAAGDGTVEVAGWQGGYGKYVRIRHNGTYSTAYAHMSGFAGGLRKGQKVRQGQIIGYVGTTGRSTGPHLHYEVLVDGSQINPLSVRLPTGRKLDGEELRRFRQMLDGMRPQIAAMPLQSRLAQGGG